MSRFNDDGFWEQYCEVCGNFDKDWIHPPTNKWMKGKNKNCGTCTYSQPSNFKRIEEEEYYEQIQ